MTHLRSVSCGSGIIDMVAQLYLAGIADAGGRMKTGHPRVRERDGQLEFVLATRRSAMGFRQWSSPNRDVRASSNWARPPSGRVSPLCFLRTIYVKTRSPASSLAGAFGSYLDVSSALDIGMFPAIPVDRFKQVGTPPAWVPSGLYIHTAAQRGQGHRRRCSLHRTGRPMRFQPEFHTGCSVG